jgi:hypothetical protein
MMLVANDPSAASPASISSNSPERDFAESIGLGIVAPFIAVKAFNAGIDQVMQRRHTLRAQLARSKQAVRLSKPVVLVPVWTRRFLLQRLDDCASAPAPIVSKPIADSG